MSILLFFVTVLSRLPFTSEFLYHMDSGHFALAMREFDVLHHQPHPPGYFLYVMLGRVFNIFAGDENYALVLMSVLFSALTIVIIYYLGRELFNDKIGIFAALLALTSPNFWFHGEVALTYATEAFFSALIGFVCWRIIEGNKEYLWFSAIILAIAGGFRQNTPIFLLPLWLYSVRKESPGKIFAAIGVFLLVSIAWFLPMLEITGGAGSYFEAFQELWKYNTGNNSAFEKGWPAIKLYGEVIYIFIFYTIAAALPILFLAFYAFARNKNRIMPSKRKTLFLAYWMLPSLFFYLLIFISPINPGYILIIFPPLLLISATAIEYFAGEINRITGRNFFAAIAVIVLLVNASLFLFSHYPVSRNEIHQHDRNLSVLFTSLETLNPSSTYLFMDHYLYSYRHSMVYLPEYQVYQMDIRVRNTGKKRKLFFGKKGKTLFSESIEFPPNVNKFATLLVLENKNGITFPPGLSLRKLSNKSFIVSGPVERVVEVYPEVGLYLTKSGK